MNKSILLTALALSFVTACSSTKPPVVKAEASTPTPAIEVQPMPPVQESMPVVSVPVITNHNSVYFSFNKYTIDEKYQGIIKANSEYLLAHPDAKVQVIGNTDDMGSVEYNLALGQRRAAAVKTALVAAGGANANQVEAISHGKVEAKYPNDMDSNRALNRRTDIIYKSGQPTGYSSDSKNLPIVDGSFYSGTIPEGAL